MLKRKKLKKGVTEADEENIMLTANKTNLPTTTSNPSTNFYSSIADQCLENWVSDRQSAHKQ